MKTSLRTTLLLFFATGIASLAIAADPMTPEEKEQHQRKLFARLDADSDGKVTEREFAVAVLWDEFLKYDANQDGKVSQAEYEAQEKSKNIWDELDPDGKGSFTFEDCFESKEIIDELRAEWRRLTSKLGKENESVPHITISDLPDLTP